MRKKLKKIYKYLWLLLYIFLLVNNKFVMIASLILLVIYLFIVLKYALANAFIARTMSLYNVHVFGKKGRGKDLSTQLAIYKRYHRQYNKKVKELIKQYDMLVSDYNLEYDLQYFIDIYFYYNPLYLSNINYGYGCRIVDINELKLYDTKTNKMLTYEDFINGTYKNMNIVKKPLFEGLDYYLSDAQTGLPNTEHKQLDKMYPWLPIFIALSRQLYNMNVIVNTQEYQRLWIKLRGQQDVYIRALNVTPMNKSYLKTIWHKIPILKNYLFIKIRYYEEQQSAENNVLPFNASGLINEGTKHLHLSAGQATKEQFEATNGVIKDYKLCIKIDNIKYDSRIFHEYVFGYKYEEE